MRKSPVKFIDSQALLHNVRVIKKTLPHRLICAVVKADAYGHHLPSVVATIKNEVDYFAVNNMKEAKQVCKIVSKPILILGMLTKKELQKKSGKNIELSMFCKEMLEKIAKKGEKDPQKCKIHIKVDTGMHRLGFSHPTDLEEIRQLKGIKSVGIFTHMGSGKGSRSHGQLKKFQEFSKLFPENFLKHYANSATALRYPPPAKQMVRVGIALYGYQGFNNLKPVMSIYASVIHLLSVRRGEKIGYGNKHRAKKNMRIAVLNIGYADGLPRVYHKKGWVILHNRPAKIVADICMNMTLVNTTGIPVQIGDYAILMGESKDLSITAEEIARKCHTIPYEILTNFSKIPCTKKNPRT